jgi:hypothetical protein
MNQQLLPALRKELENSFGRKILSSRDCLQLVDDIYAKTGYTINANTLRRFFGLVKTNYSASPSTLTILSKYCGFNSMDEIGKIAVSASTDTSINSEEILRYLVSLFRNTPPTDGHDPVLHSLVQQTILFLERNPTLIDRFQREIAKTTAGQYYYFEQSVNMDRLNGYYGDGLRHYLRGKNTNEARIFAHSLQVFRYWLTKSPESMEKHITEMAGINVSQHYPPHILGRFIAARLFYANLKKDESIDRILAEAKKYNTIIKISHGNSFPEFELIVCEALVLTGHLEEANEYVPQNKSFFSGIANSPFGIWEDILKHKRPYKYKTSRNSNNQDTPPPNEHLTKRYTIIVKHSLGRVQKSKHEARTVQLEELIKETGFVRFL